METLSQSTMEKVKIFPWVKLYIDEYCHLGGDVDKRANIALIYLSDTPYTAEMSSAWQNVTPNVYLIFQYKFT